MIDSKKYWEAQILQQMDDEARAYNFPILNNQYLVNAGIRLATFRSDSEWLIVFQEVAFTKKHGFVNVVSAYGSMVDNPGTQRAVDLISAAPGQSVRDDQGWLRLKKEKFDLTIRGEVFAMSPTSEDYRKAGIDPGPDMSDAVQILRYLAFLKPEKLFLSDEELLEICGRADAGLENFLQLEAWYHPNIADDELPSQSLCFQSLARALAQNDREIYDCSKETWNTHWSNWQNE